MNLIPEEVLKVIFERNSYVYTIPIYIDDILSIHLYETYFYPETYLLILNKEENFFSFNIHKKFDFICLSPNELIKIWSGKSCFFEKIDLAMFKACKGSWSNQDLRNQVIFS